MDITTLRLRAVGVAVAAACVAGPALAAPASAHESSATAPTSTGAVPNLTRPVIWGAPVRDNDLTADPGTWEGEVTFTYQWQRDSIDVPGATTPTYRLTSADSAHVLTVVVTATAGTDSSSLASDVFFIPPMQVVGLTRPSISGEVELGQTLTAGPGTWDPAEPILAYQWTRDGEVIGGATGPTYTVVAEDLGHDLGVAVTANKPSFTTGTTTSSTHTPVNYEPPTLWSPTVDDPVGVNPGVWDLSPNELDLTYQWKHEGVDIDGATGATFTPPFGWIGTELSVTVWASAGGHRSAGVTSEPSVIDKGSVKPVVTPTISGDPRPGNTLSVTGGTYSVASSTQDYEWQLDGEDIPGATSSTYVVRPQDVGRQIRVFMIASAPGWNQGMFYTDSVTVWQGILRAASAPVVTGRPLVGQTLSATPAGWSATDGFTRRYAWTVDGASVASGATFTVPASAAGKQVGVIETTGGAAYKPASQRSATVLAQTASSTSFKVVKVKRKGKVVKGKVQVVATVASAVPATGTVTVRLNKATRTVAISGGKATATFTRVKKGKAKVSVTYAGSTAVVGSTSSGSVRIR